MCVCVCVFLLHDINMNSIELASRSSESIAKIYHNVNGQNAHVTVRSPDWWKGFIDGVSSDFPQIEKVLMCTDLNRKIIAYKIWSAKLWHQSEKFKINN